MLETRTRKRSCFFEARARLTSRAPSPRDRGRPSESGGNVGNSVAPVDPAGRHLRGGERGRGCATFESHRNVSQSGGNLLSSHPNLLPDSHTPGRRGTAGSPAGTIVTAYNGTDSRRDRERNATSRVRAALTIGDAFRRFRRSGRRCNERRKTGAGRLPSRLLRDCSDLRSIGPIWNEGGK